jgi:DNA replication protein DnaC
VPDAYGVPERLSEASFDNFDLRLNPSMKLAVERCRAVAEGHEWCALLVGDYGVGKSHLAVAALRASRHPKPGQFWPTAALLLHIRKRTIHDDVPEGDVLLPLQTMPALLVLDDMGAEKLTEWANQTLYGVLNARYEARLPTIVTTNTPEAIDERILDRYWSGRVPCTGQSVRRLKGDVMQQARRAR